MAGVANQNQGTTRRHILASLHVNLGHERAGCVEHVEAALFRVALDGLRDTVRAENRHGAMWHFIEFFDKARAFLAQVVHHVAIVNNLVANIHGRAVLL